MTHPDYFEGILQLRNPNKELIDFVKNEVKKAKVRIAKTVKQKNGIDLYISSQKFLRQLGRMLPKRFDGVLKSTRKLFSRKRETSKNIYRVNVMFKLNSFSKGDIVKYKGVEYEIITVGTQIHLKEIGNGKKKRVKAVDLQK